MNLKHENKKTILKIILKAIPNIWFLNNSEEKSSKCCSKNPLFTTSLKGGRLYFKNFIKKTISFEDKLYTIRALIEFYLLMRISSIFNDKFFLLLATNICLFYAPLDKKYPYFVLKIRMSVKQIIEGVIVLILCLVPKYEEEQKEQKIE